LRDAARYVRGSRHRDILLKRCLLFAYAALRPYYFHAAAPPLSADMLYAYFAAFAFLLPRRHSCFAALRRFAAMILLRRH